MGWKYKTIFLPFSPFHNDLARRLVPTSSSIQVSPLIFVLLQGPFNTLGAIMHPFGILASLFLVSSASAVILDSRQTGYPCTFPPLSSCGPLTEPTRFLSDLMIE